MADQRPPDPAVAERRVSDRLETWGEIASYLGREIRTVQRWEKTMGLPVRRLAPGPDKLSRVYAHKHELDAWWREHETVPAGIDPSEDSSASSATVAPLPSSGALPKPIYRRALRWGTLIAATALLTYLIPKAIDHIWPSRIIVGVQPFRNLGNSGDDFIAAGFTEEMVSRLEQLHPDRWSVIRLNMAGKAGLSSVRATYVLQGTVRRVNDQVAITAQLTQTNNQNIAWANSYGRDVKDLLRVQTEVADAITSEVLTRLPTADRPTREVNREAYLSYLEGRYFWSRRTAEDIQKATASFEKSIRIDSTYAPAYAGLADCYELSASAPYTSVPPRDAFPKAETAARKALELDPSLAEAHVSLGYAELAYEWNVNAADREFRRALQLRPRYATAHQFYAYSLTVMGEPSEAIAERTKAVDLDPINPLMASALGEAYYQARQFDRTIELNQRALELDPTYAVALVNIGRAYQQKGMHPQAQAAFQKILAVAPEDPAVLALLGHDYALSGRRADAQQIAAQLKRISARRYVPALYFALISMGLGDKDDAFRWLDAAVEERAEYLIYLASEPLADPLRRDPRFAGLLKKIGIQQLP